MEKEWIAPAEFTDAENKLVEEFIEVFRCPPLIAKLLLRAGHDSAQQVEDFFASQLSHLHDPMLFGDMDKRSRIVQALENKENYVFMGL